MTKITLLLALLMLHTVLTGQIKINEMVSANYTGVMDEDQETHDWIELYNTSDAEVAVDGYFLTDNREKPDKWQLPAMRMAGKSFLLVMASGKNRTALPLNRETIIDGGDHWRYIIPTTNIGTTWHQPGFDDSQWQEGASGFGFDDGDDATLLPLQTVSVFIRKRFVISAAEQVKQLVLHIDYDDGFVAYINGIEVARANLGTVGSTVAYNAMAINHEALMYNGGQPQRFIIANTAGLLREGENIISIHGHNASASSSDMSLIPFLSIETTAQTSNRVHAYYNLSASYLHTNFKIDNSGESIYLVSPEGSIVDSIGAIALEGDISYGRQPDGNDQFFYFTSPTPASSNNSQMGTTSLVLNKVQFMPIGGYYPQGTTVSLSSENVDDQIYYTTDGSTPTASSTSYKAPLNISGDKVVRARIINSGTLPGPVTTQTYIGGIAHRLPIVSVTTSPENLWDEQTGIYVMGSNASAENPYYGANFWQDWEKPGNVEIYNANQQQVLNAGCGIKIHGAWTRAYEQKTLALYARNAYGDKAFDARLFSDKPIDSFQSLVLRNGGNDFYSALMRDGVISCVTRGMNVDRLAFQPAVNYLNGQYWGILNIREKISEHYLADNHGFGTREVNLLTNNTEVVQGDATSYRALLSAVNNALNTSANFAAVADKMDLDNYIQYQVSQIYFDNTDWPGNNIKYWRLNSENSKWRWILYDSDFGFGLYDQQAYRHNTLSFAMAVTNVDWPNPSWSTLLFRRLLTSTEFRNQFVNSYCDRLNSTFLPANVNAKIDSLKALYEGEIQHHLKRWDRDYSGWAWEVSRLKSFATQRPAQAWNHLQTTFALGTRHNVKISINSPHMGDVRLNTIVVSDGFIGSYFQNIPIVLTARPKAGYRFVRWEGSRADSTSVITHKVQGDVTLKAVFAPASELDVHVVINEINCQSAPERDTGDWVELLNNGTATVDLSGWTLSDQGKQEAFSLPEGTLLYPGEYLMVCHDRRAFRNHYPMVKSSVGDFVFGLGGEGDKLFLCNKQGVTMDALEYGTTSPWPEVVPESGATLELKNPRLNNVLSSSWVLNVSGGTPGRANVGFIAITDDDVDGDEPPTEIKETRFNCFPTVFTDFTTLELRVAKTTHCTIDVLNLSGRVMSRVMDQTLDKDVYTLDWPQGRDLNAIPKGVYLVRCIMGDQKEVIKVVKTE
ncbi:putative secreted protein (Por secretion system target) [Breznakibacter xylanolyticus]|uniref:Putative secreted protein (Por secretion system target) n=1 Tax=Breznakibacter xylanolyticus TaxID=990 RepID=A0A2W7MWS3_9BACT|nr:CotH kinase family protein [Breznakibacter xylanolyticus]PZX12408.1 putative secreted protein (Por secretion system target) [Breznakibacter xylanolyticus]